MTQKKKSKETSGRGKTNRKSRSVFYSFRGIAPNAAKLINKNSRIPTIGIGSSSNCDGQILVTDDMLGISGFYPKFVKKYASLNRVIEKAVKKYTRSETT